MNIDDLFPLQRILIDEVYQSRKRVLEVLAGLLADDQLGGAHATHIFEILIERERLGCTAIGHGIAIPHGRDKDILRPRGAVIRLTEGIDFGSADNQPVNLIIGLIVPDEYPESHVAILGILAQHLADDKDREAMLNTQSAERIRGLMRAWLSPLATSDD
ncbi:MAG: PTS sugar transporter subunit IIA [Halothiobacillus sp.]